MLYNWNIIGHEQELAFLENHIRNGQLGHAYLFVGPRNIGKFTIAKTFAQILQCEKEFCQTCPVCVQVKKGVHLDTIEIPDDGSSIKIEPVRDIIARLNMTPQSRYKILLVKNIGRLTEEAGNSLLKLVEEPTPRTIFLFTAEHAREVLPTLLSRVYEIKFQAIPENIFRGFLKQNYEYLREDTLDQIFMLSFGAPGRAVSLLENEDLLLKSKEFFEKTKRFLDEKTVTDRFSSLSDLAENPEYVREFLLMLLTVVRHRALMKNSARERTHYVRLLEKIPETMELLQKNVNARLALENLALEFSP